MKVWSYITCGLRFVALLLEPLEEGVVHQLLDRGAVLWVLLQAAVQEVSCLGREDQIGRDLDLVLNDLHQLLLLSDAEGILAHQHLIHHYTDRPDVDLLVVLVAFEDLGADVERSAAESSPQFVVLVD